MNSKTKNMTQGKPAVLMLAFALPLMAGNIFQQLYTVVDTMIVGKALGVDSLAALGAADWLNWMMLGIVQGFAQGFAIRMSQEFGAGDMAGLRRTVGCSTGLALMFSVLLVAIGQLIAEPVLTLLQTPGEIMPNTLLYLRIMFAGMPIVMAYNLLASILRSLGDSRTPLYAMVLASVTNIVLDLLFVLGFRWGIAGAAIATLIAQVVSCIFCLYYIRKIEFLKLKRADFKLTGQLCGRLLGLGFPMAFQNAIIAIGGMIVQFVVNGCGVIFIAGYTATNKMYGLLEVAAVSYGYAVATYVGQNLGAGKIKRIREGMRAALGVALLTSVVIAVVMLLLGKPILNGFLSGTPEEVAEALKVAYHYLVVMGVCLPILYLLHVVRSAIQGVGNTLLPMLSGIAEFVMRTAGALLLPAVMGNSGIFYAEVSAWIGADIVLVISYFFVMRRLAEKEE
ncbi:MAG: MATE family efflux transporter [Lachnospiraceae bacterium]|nr:MATE family efflux transporter [Lachnospiraceae bacterium]